MPAFQPAISLILSAINIFQPWALKLLYHRSNEKAISISFIYFIGYCCYDVIGFLFSFSIVGIFTNSYALSNSNTITNSNSINEYLLLHAAFCHDKYTATGNACDVERP